VGHKTLLSQSVGGLVVHWLWHWTCDQLVVSLTACHALAALVLGLVTVCGRVNHHSI